MKSEIKDMNSGGCLFPSETITANKIVSLFSNNTRVRFCATSRNNLQTFRSDIDKIKLILCAPRHEQPKIEPSELNIELIQKLMDLCHAIINCNKAWSNSNDSYHTYARTIDRLENELPKALISHGRIGIALAITRCAEVASIENIKLIVNAQRHTPKVVLEDYFRGASMNNVLSTWANTPWAIDLNTSMFAKDRFLYIHPDGRPSVSLPIALFTGGAHTNALACSHRNAATLAQTCIEKFDLSLNPELRDAEVDLSQSMI